MCCTASPCFACWIQMAAGRTQFDTGALRPLASDTREGRRHSPPAHSPCGCPCSARWIRTRHRLVAPWTARLDVLAGGAADVLTGASPSRCAAIVRRPSPPPSLPSPRCHNVCFGSSSATRGQALGHLTRLVDSDGEGCVRVPSTPIARVVPFERLAMISNPPKAALNRTTRGALN
jgi:hypothetical protein